MKNTYTIELSSIKLNNGKQAKKMYVNSIIKKSSYLIFRALLCFLTFTTVLYIFKHLETQLLIDEKFSYTETITLGALFSTLGSSIVSITSIFSEHCLKNVNQNIETLQSDQLERDKKWNRWPFVDRISKHNTTNISKEYYIYYNPSIKFSNLKKGINIPLSITDFYELKIIKSYLTLKFKRKTYRKVLAFQPNDNYLSDILIWDCLLDVYKNIVLYKTHKLFSYIGWTIVISSIMLSLLYQDLITYFNSIILTIFTGWS